MPVSPFGPGQPTDGHPIGREQAQPAVTDPPTSDHGVDVQAAPDRSGGTAAEANPVGPHLDAQLADGTASPDARDVPGQQQAATPEPDGVPAAAERLATLPLRLLAFAVDLAWVTAVVLVLMLVGTLVGVGSLRLFALVLVVGLITYLTVSVWLTGGQTIGKALFNLTVRRVDGTAFARTWRGLAWSLGRHSAGYLVADVFGL